MCLYERKLEMDGELLPDPILAIEDSLMLMRLAKYLLLLRSEAAPSNV